MNFRKDQFESNNQKKRNKNIPGNYLGKPWTEIASRGEVCCHAAYGWRPSRDRTGKALLSTLKMLKFLLSALRNDKGFRNKLDMLSFMAGYKECEVHCGCNVANRWQRAHEWKLRDRLRCNSNWEIATSWIQGVGWSCRWKEWTGLRYTMKAIFINHRWEGKRKIKPYL